MDKRPKTGGRVAGTPNKNTVAVKAALTEAFESLGSTGSLAAWAEDNKTEFYRLWSKILPQEVNLGGQNGNPVQTQDITKTDAEILAQYMGKK